jgi:hypothetical protein
MVVWLGFAVNNQPECSSKQLLPRFNLLSVTPLGMTTLERDPNTP